MKNTKKLVLCSLLTAIIILMAFTPIGYLKTLGLEITFITIPVIVGAVLLGPDVGAILGAVFGLTSFAQCFGMSPFGTQLCSINPILTFIVCVPTRIIMGWLCGLISQGLHKTKANPMLSKLFSSLFGSLLNTLLFMTALILCFMHTDYIKNMMGNRNVIEFVIWFVGLQGLIEALVCTFVGTAITQGVYTALFKGKRR